MLTADEIYRVVYGKDAGGKKLNDIPFDVFDKYLFSVKQENKFFEALDIFSDHTDAFAAPVVLRHLVFAAGRYPKREEDIKRLVSSYHEKCKNDKDNPARFASAYSIVMGNGGLLPNASTKGVIGTIEQCTAKDMWLVLNGGFENDYRRKMIVKQYTSQKEMYDKLMIKYAGIFSSDMYKEGFSMDFSVLSYNDASFRSELKSTTKAKFKADSKNSDILNIEGTDKYGKHTFSFRVDRTTGYYIYAGGKPEEIFSNDPSSKFPPLPKTVLECLKHNNRLSKTIAARNAILRVGVQYTEDNKQINVTRSKDKIVEIRISGADKKPVSWFCINTETGEYKSMDCKTNKKYSNIPQYKGECEGVLSENDIGQFKTYANIAKTRAQNRARVLTAIQINNESSVMSI